MRTSCGNGLFRYVRNDNSRAQWMNEAIDQRQKMETYVTAENGNFNGLCAVA